MNILDSFLIERYDVNKKKSAISSVVQSALIITLLITINLGSLITITRMLYGNNRIVFSKKFQNPIYIYIYVLLLTSIFLIYFFLNGKSTPLLTAYHLNAALYKYSIKIASNIFRYSFLVFLLFLVLSSW